ncbi:MAG: N-acetyltransferase [Bacteroidota bacterium]
MIQIRPETPADFPNIRLLLQAAFEGQEHSDQSEHLLVERLRQSPSYLASLAMVAEREGQLLGFILLTKISILEGERRFPSLALAPVAVWPEWQGQGIGAQLIEAAHQEARQLGHSSVVLLGHADYYPRFGYQAAHKYGIRLPFDLPPENCMVLPLTERALDGVSGVVEYDAAFFA